MSQMAFAEAKEVVEIAQVLTVDHRFGFSSKQFLDCQNGELARCFITYRFRST